jgi:hypothetical protein
MAIREPACRKECLKKAISTRAAWHTEAESVRKKGELADTTDVHALVVGIMFVWLYTCGRTRLQL